MMSLCDVCAQAGAVEVVTGEAFEKAVRDGYNPFAMGPSGPTLEQIVTMAQISGADPYEVWRHQHVAWGGGDRVVCSGCIPALRPFLERDTATPLTPAGGGPSACSKCGGMNPTSQWHCSHCGHIQWGLILSSLIVGIGLAWWALSIASWWGRGIVGLLALLFLWIGVSSIREGLRGRRYR